jgi:hypothetical protein
MFHLYREYRELHLRTLVEISGLTSLAGLGALILTAPKWIKVHTPSIALPLANISTKDYAL